MPSKPRFGELGTATPETPNRGVPEEYACTCSICTHDFDSTGESYGLAALRCQPGASRAGLRIVGLVLAHGLLPNLRVSAMSNGIRAPEEK